MKRKKKEEEKKIKMEQTVRKKTVSSFANSKKRYRPWSFFMHYQQQAI